MTGLWQGCVAKGRWRAPENGACSSGPKSSTTEEGYRVCLRSTFLSVSKKSGLFFFRKRGKKGTLLKKVLIRRAFEEAFLKNRETFLRRVGRCSVRVNEDHRGVQRISQSDTEKRTARRGNRRCFFASLERPSVVHRLEPIRGRLPSAGLPVWIYQRSQGATKGTKEEAD